ncbi:zinc knuckle CX2CX4HX4C containing protein [Tanacetum coccineum]
MNRDFLKSGIASKIKNIEGKKTSTGGTLNKAIRNIQDVAIPLDAKEKVCEFFTNTINGYFIGKRLAFPIMDMYVKNAWAKYGLECAIMRNTRLHKDVIKAAPVWVKIHNVPIVAYSETGLSLITTKLGRPIMLDTYTSEMCLNLWGHYDYARVLVEVSSDLAFVKSLVVAIPFSDKPEHYLEMLDVEYEWQPPRCDVCKTFDHNGEQCPKRSCEPKHTPNVEDGFVQVTQKKKQHSMAARSRQIEGIRLPKTKSNWIYRAVTKPPPKETSSVTNVKPKYIDDNINKELVCKTY